ncbi:hypothetical protein BEWA_024340 [Theileria equi strain WA]|uniref:URB1 C-terminal domain-containing protein n=1 Tax=Theileria equi strain WA TaxID=1537102 RepID=L0AVK9_THEEQ|nr:hypothetical protein BEWA_024340 [Theileria equi strain WA]AFZ79585.1 hypothetical protein BEWA_024340 [Theileria equi strain WA]|eukprot:XP_004829251.1 hypothetical protein BEWA_024340 [Theileria equi strain WA]
MDAITGVRIASCIVKGEFETICPEFKVKGTISKKKRGEVEEKENTLYKPFNCDPELARLYIKASPKCVELLDLLGSETKETRCRALALISYIMSELQDDLTATRIAEHISTNSGTLFSSLFINDDVTIYYLLDVILETVRLLTNEKIRFLIRSTDLYNILEKYHITTREDENRTILNFYNRFLKSGMIDDFGLLVDNERENKVDSMDIFYINGKKKACILLMLGLKGFNIFERGNAVKLIFDHIKGDAKISGTCMLHIVICILSTILNKYCNHLSLPNERSKDVPLNVIDLISTHLSRFFNADLKRMFTEYLEVVEMYCDAATLSNVLLKFEITEYTLEPLLETCKRDKRLSKHYLSNMKCKYPGHAEYLLLLKFAISWFEAEETRLNGDTVDEVVLPAFMTKSFFNHGLLSKEKKCIHGTLFLLFKFMDFISKTNVDPFLSMFPDFKTIINCKTFKEDEITLNVRGRNVHIELLLPNDMLIDWLFCLSKYATTLDMKSLYDPCKLFKDERIAGNIDYISNLFGGSAECDGSENDINNALKLDLAVMDCLFHLGIKSSESFIGKVQETAFRYILQRFVEVNSAFRNKYKEYREKCREYVFAVMNSTGIVDDNIATYVDSIQTMHQHKLFMFLFNTCATKPLDVLYGLHSGGNVKRTKAKCTNCLLDGYLQESLFLRLLIDITLQRDTEDDIACTECSSTFSNIAKLVKKQGIPMEDTMIYIKDVCKSVLNTDLINERFKRELCKQLSIGAEDCTPLSPSVPDVVHEQTPRNETYEASSNTYLEMYRMILEHVSNVDHLYVPKLKTILQVLLSRQGIFVKGECKNLEYLERCTCAKESSLYLGLFVMAMSVLEMSPLDGFGDHQKLLQLMKEVVERRNDLSLPLFCISHKINGNDPTSQEEKMIKSKLTLFLKNEKEKDNTQLLYISTAMKGKPHLWRDEKTFRLLVKRLQDSSPCKKCSDLSTCGYVRIMSLLEICAQTLPADNLKLCIDIIQSDWLFNIAKMVTSLNGHVYFLGDNIENHAFRALLGFLSKLLKAIFTNVGTVVEIKKSRIRRLFGVLAPCYRCSLTEVDLLLKDVIFSIINLANGLISDNSRALKLPMFKDFLCTSLGDISPYGGFNEKRYSDDTRSEKRLKTSNNGSVGGPGKSDVCHGLSNWIAMSSGITMKSTESNWLRLNSKRVNSTVSNLALQISQDGMGVNKQSYGLQDTLHKLSILYPPLTRVVAGTDVLFGYIIRLNKALGATTRCLQDFIISDPYVYDLDYLIPYISGRLCLVLQRQINSFSEFKGKFEEIEDGHVPKFQVFKKFHNDKDADAAARRLYHQYKKLTALPETFLDDTIDVKECIDSCINNGILELVILGLLSERFKKASARLLSLFTKILENSIDVAILRAHTPNAVFRMGKLEYRGSLQILSLLYSLEDLQNPPRGEENESDIPENEPPRDPTMHIIFISQAVKRVIKPEDALYQEINKFILSRHHRNVRDIPLFYECFIAQEVKTQRSNLAFILNILGIYTSVSGNYDILSKRHVFQHILSYSLVSTVHLEHVSQIAMIILRASSNMYKELLDMDVHSWICNLATFTTSRLDDDSTRLVWTSFLLTILTHIVHVLSNFSPMQEPANTLLDSWNKVHLKLPRLKPYHFILLKTLKSCMHA